MKFFFNYIIFYLLFLSICSAQWFELNHQLITRSYYMSYPDENFDEPASLIINMHGYGGNALNQRY